MKQLVVTLFFIGASLFAEAQVNPHAIGLRFRGDGYKGTGAEISYQHGFGDKNRLELDLGGRRHKDWKHVGLAAIYHWDWNLTSGLNWYIGPGAMIGMFDARDNWRDDGLTLAVGGQIGLEFDFNEMGAPILLSIDARPMWEIWSYYNYYNWGYEGAFSIRYTF